MPPLQGSCLHHSLPPSLHRCTASNTYLAVQLFCIHTIIISLYPVHFDVSCNTYILPSAMIMFRVIDYCVITSRMCYPWLTHPSSTTRIKRGVRLKVIASRTTFPLHGSGRPHYTHVFKSNINHLLSLPSCRSDRTRGIISSPYWTDPVWALQRLY